MVVCLEWFLNPHHAPLVIGKEQGFFREEGFSLKLVSAAGSDEGCKQVAAGKADLALTGQPHYMMVLAKNLPLIRVASLIDSPLEVWVSWHPLDQLKNLKRLRFAHASSGKGFSMKLLDHFIQDQQIAPDRVEKLMVRHGLATAFLSQQVDVILNVFKTYSLADITAKAPKVTVFPLKDLGIPPYDELIFVANRTSLDRKKMLKFTRALKKSIAFMKHHPREAWQSFTRAYPELNSPVNQTVWLEVSKVFATNPGYFDAQKYETFSQFLKKIDFVEQKNFPILGINTN